MISFIIEEVFDILTRLEMLKNKHHILPQIQHQDASAFAHNRFITPTRN